MTIPVHPTLVARWALAGSIVEPPESKKYIGWSGAEAPEASYFNWFMNRVGEQLRFISYERNVWDSFAYGATGTVVWYPTQMAPFWAASNSGANIQLGVGGYGSVSNANGVTNAWMSRNAGGLQPIYRDFIFEADVVNQYSASGCQFEIGVLDQNARPLVVFSYTGASPMWHFSNYRSVGTGAGATTYIKPLGVAVHQADGVHMLLSAERVGATLHVDISGERLFALQIDELYANDFQAYDVYMRLRGSAVSNNEVRLHTLLWGVKR